MKNTLETRLGIFVALAVIAAVIIVETIGGMEGFKRGIRLHALFDTVRELKVGDRVKMAGVEVGTVEKIKLEQGKARVIMKVRTDAGVKTDSIASVLFAGLMGQNFVSLSFGAPNATLAAEGTVLSTEEQPDIGSIMKKLDNVATGVENLTKSFTGDKIDNLLGPLTDFVKQNSGQLTATISNIQMSTAKIASGEGTVGKLIYEDTLYASTMATMTNLESTVNDIKATVNDARTMLASVKEGQGTLGKLMTDDSLYYETRGSMTNLHQILMKINSGQGTVGKLVNDQEFYKNAKLTLQKVDKATEGLEDQGPLSILSIAVNGLF
jgi:phospholipid/cholesterol/gamma-HCH transport system substrate-binding protein